MATLDELKKSVDYEEDKFEPLMTIEEINSILEKCKERFESKWKKAFESSLTIFDREWIKDFPNKIDVISFRNNSMFIRVEPPMLTSPNINNLIFFDYLLTYFEAMNSEYYDESKVIGFDYDVSTSGKLIDSNDEEYRIPLEKMKYDLSATGTAIMTDNANMNMDKQMRNILIDSVIGYRKSASIARASNAIWEYYHSQIDTRFNEAIEAIQNFYNQIFKNKGMRIITEKSSYFYMKIDSTIRGIPADKKTAEIINHINYVNMVCNHIIKEETQKVEDESYMEEIESGLLLSSINIGDDMIRHIFESDRIMDETKGFMYFLFKAISENTDKVVVRN